MPEKREKQEFFFFCKMKERYVMFNISLLLLFGRSL